jgi:hypothetical protein
MPFASCHCGAVQIKVTEKPLSVTECNCSICRRYGAQWAFYTQNTAQVSCDPGSLSMYTWGKKSLEFYHCNICGCVTHYENTDKSETGRIAVNARIMSPTDVIGIEVRTFDGADTWKYLDE